MPPLPPYFGGVVQALGGSILADQGVGAKWSHGVVSGWRGQGTPRQGRGGHVLLFSVPLQFGWG